MTSTVEIGNMALGHLGAKTTVQHIFPTPEESVEAGTLHLYWGPALQAVLAAHDWGFARTTRELALLGSPPSDWFFSYARPSDCVAPREIVKPNAASTARDPEPIGFSESYDADLKQHVILTNQEHAILRYTALVENTEIWDDSFVFAFSWKLAWLCSPKITGGKLDRSRAAAEGYEYAINAAMTANRNQSKPHPRPLPRVVRARRS